MPAPTHESHTAGIHAIADRIKAGNSGFHAIADGIHAMAIAFMPRLMGFKRATPAFTRTPMG
jgi:hypothetical protein